MNKVIFIIVCLICSPTLLWATPRTVTITWAMTDTTDVQSYKVYYADNPEMTNKINHTDCSAITKSPTNTFSITCNNVDLTDNQTYYFTIIALMSDSELSSVPKNATYTTIEITKVQNFSIVTPGENIAPTAAFSTNTTSGAPPLTVNFDATASTDIDGSVVAYSWDFGDGSTIDKTINPSHTFSSTGSFTVILTVTDNKGETGEQRATINATETPTTISEIIGNEEQYTTGRHIMHNTIVAYKLPSTPNYDGILESISFTLGGFTGKHMRFALYTHDGTNDLPDEIVPGASTVEGITTTDAFDLVTLRIANETKPLISAGIQYWLVLQSTDDWLSFGATWDGGSKIAYKDVESYNFGSWGGVSSETNPYKIGACYFSYVPLQ